MSDGPSWVSPIPPAATHWTRKGTFKIVGKPHAGSWWWFLFLDDREICPGSYVDLIAQTLARGDYDDLIGFPTAPLNIPPDYLLWNMGKVPL